MAHFLLRCDFFPDDLGLDTSVRQLKNLEHRVNKRVKAVCRKPFRQALHKKAERLHAVHVEVVATRKVLLDNPLHRFSNFFLGVQFYLNRVLFRKRALPQRLITVNVKLSNVVVCSHDRHVVLVDAH